VFTPSDIAAGDIATDDDFAAALRAERDCGLSKLGR
jgi:hypothetical protein